jgi:hypothetical protein
MKTRAIAILISILALIVLVTACSSGATSTPPASTTALDGATLVQARCSACHSLTRVERMKYTAADWKKIVDLMISRGAKLTPAEETLAVNYLATNFGK